MRANLHREIERSSDRSPRSRARARVSRAHLVILFNSTETHAQHCTHRDESFAASFAREQVVRARRRSNYSIGFGCEPTRTNKHRMGANPMPTIGRSIGADERLKDGGTSRHRYSTNYLNNSLKRSLVTCEHKYRHSYLETVHTEEASEAIHRAKKERE